MWKNAESGTIDGLESESDKPGKQEKGGFSTTCWRMFLSHGASRDENPEAHDAFGQLCRAYWRPIFAFICRKGFSVSDAQDLTQDFFLLLLEGKLLQRADPAKGRFRAVLLTALKYFLNDTRRRKSALKRGGGVTFISWEEWLSETSSRLTVAPNVLHDPSAERLFDLRWAATLTEQALQRLADECASKGRRRVFDVLSGYLTTERDEISYAELGRTLGVGAGKAKQLVWQMRQRYRVILRKEVARTVERLSDVDDEIRYLCSVLAAMGNETK